MRNNRGSEWRKWDLHVHTKGTNKNDQFNSPDFNSFCVTLFKKAIEKGIKTIGITDYFSIDNYKEVVDFVKNISTNSQFNEAEKELVKEILLLPNVELRMLPVTDKGRLINIHCIFNPLYTTNLENDFFGSITFNDGNRSYMMNRAGFIALGKSLDPTINSDSAAYKKGIENFVVECRLLKELCDSNSQFRENTIIVVSNSSTDGASGMQKHYDLFEHENGSLDGVRKAIYQISDCIFSSNQKDIDFFLGKKEGHTPDSIKEKCGSLKPCIHGSDAHKEGELFCPDNNKYCWIKADLTFSGLKQVLYEPEERVKIQQDKPDDKKGYQVIDSVTLQEEGFWDDTIYLNENLNTIIGGRSTGKSTLLKSIARKIDANVELDEEKDFINNHLDGIFVKWKDSLEDTSRYIQFFPQNYMYTIAKNKNRELDELIEKIIVNKDKKQILKTYHDSNKDIEKTLSKNILDLFQLQTELTDLQVQLKEKGNKNGVVSEIFRLIQKIEDMSKNTEITKNELDKYQNCLISIGDNKHSIGQANDDIRSLKMLKDRSIFNDDLVYHFDNLSDTLKGNVTKYFEQLKEQVTEQWKGQLDSYIRERNDEITKNSTNKTGLENSDIFKKGKVYYENNKELADIQSKLREENEKLQKIKEIEKKVENATDRKNKMVETIINEHLKYQTNAIKLIELLKINHEDIEISTKIKCQVEDMFEFLKQRCNLKGIEIQDYIQQIKDNYETETKDVVKKFVEDTLQNKINFKSSNTAQNVLTEFLTRNWYKYSFELTYQQDGFAEMSPGKKAFVILKLLLDFDVRECPILIDQPEDSLDNRNIYNELVQYIKSKKKTRQIILVTHNSNVVVNADSENVIVANQQGKNSNNKNDIKFQYVNGSLENTKIKETTNDIILGSQGIREHVCEILEGGKEAFENREKKYGFKK